MEQIIQKYSPIIGEFVWHSLTSDPNIIPDSNIHYDRITECIKKWSKKPIRNILEVASYAHITGYKLQQTLNAEVTLFDISASALKLGRKTALEQGYEQIPELITGDFHDLPFENCSFDLVYIASAIHHTEQYTTVIKELQRVLTPEGLLIILNEPYQREACFYKFRCNRSYALTSFEKQLKELGLLRTIAEPHPGSRDEALFGMIENQQIPLRKFLSTLSTNCEIDEVKTNYETHIGPLERQWLTWANDRKISPSLLAIHIEKHLNKKINSARQAIEEVAIGLDFSVPNKKEIKEMSQHIALKLNSCPQDTDSLPYEQHLSELFGGSVFVVGHKKTSLELPIPPPHKPSLNTYSLKDGVRMCFIGKIPNFLNQEYSILPKLQIDQIKKIHKIFPKSDWIIRKEDNGFTALTPTSKTAKIILPPSRSNYLILLRINFSLPKDHCFYQFKIFNNSQQIYEYSVFREDAILYREIVTPSMTSYCTLSCTITSLANHNINKFAPFQALKIYYAGIFTLPCS